MSEPTPQDITTEADTTDLDTPIWGAKHMAPVINRNERQVRHLIDTGRLDVTQMGKLYTSTRRRLLTSMGVLR